MRALESSALKSISNLPLDKAYNICYTTLLILRMKKTLLSFSFALLALVGSSVPAFADIVCQPVYGGGQTCTQVGPVVIDKKVANPTNGQFTDNLGVNDPKFAPDQSISFQISVTNTGSTVLSKITVADTFPFQVTNIAGPGSINDKTVTFDELNLNPNESRTRILSGKIVPTNQLPDGTICVINQAAIFGNGQTRTDSAQFCIQKSVPVVTQVTQVITQPQTVVIPARFQTKGGLKVFPPAKVFKTPSTGPEAILLAILVPTGLIGQFIRKKALS